MCDIALVSKQKLSIHDGTTPNILNDHALRPILKCKSEIYVLRYENAGHVKNHGKSHK